MLMFTCFLFSGCCCSCLLCAMGVIKFSQPSLLGTCFHIFLNMTVLPSSSHPEILVSTGLVSLHIAVLFFFCTGEHIPFSIKFRSYHCPLIYDSLAYNIFFSVSVF